MTFFAKIYQWFKNALFPDNTSHTRALDNQDSVIPEFTSKAPERTRETYIARGALDSQVLATILRRVNLSLQGAVPTSSQRQTRAKMIKAINDFIKNGRPASHEFGLTVVRSPLSIRYSLHHYDHNRNLVDGFVLEISN